MTQVYELHPLCTYFPRLEGPDFDALRDDIAAHGLREPIMLLEGKILDGGNRYRACLAAGVAPKFSEFVFGNPVEFVLSANLHRRHLSAGQRATIVALASDWANAYTHGGARKKFQAEALPLEKVRDRSALSGATERTQRVADKLVKSNRAKAEQVSEGKVSLYAATKPKPLKQVEKSEPAPEEGPTLAELVDELQRENETLRAQLKAGEADDLRAEAVKWAGLYQHSKREQGHAMDAAAAAQKREAYAVKMCRACGKAAGVADPNHTDLRDIVKAVQAFARRAA